MSSEPTPQSEPETTPEEYRSRALLLADLGRYDEAAGEIAAGLASAPADPGLLTTLARVHVAAGQAAAALEAADRAATSAPAAIEPLVVRAMALADDRRFAEAAHVASEILVRWPEDAFAQRTGAALLSESRNGQEALNAAWNGVRLAPREAEAHLVLAVVAARLRLFDLAQRGYGEALELDSAIGDAQRDVGVVRLERRRWAVALEALADEATLPPVPDPDQPSPAPVVEVSRPHGLVLDRSVATTDAVRHAVLFGANGVIVTAVLSAVMTLASTGVARMWAAVIGVVILAGTVGWLARQVRPEPLGTVLRRLAPRSSLAVYAAAPAPVLLVLYALIGGLVPLVAAMVLAAAAELVVLTHRP
ncbi:hypothetical protein AB0J80_00870 [Actinoplanes sp. NPDC049548]|uniref:hypothetical protein n=1 Tax=Actinoplanes sp. NPDC049548 TaxID=3155152 RepID=UPI003435FA9D